MRSLVLACALVALSLLPGCSMKGKKAAERAVVDFHHRLDAGDFAAIYAGAHPDFKKATTSRDFVALLSAIHRKLGRTLSSEEVGWRINAINFHTNVVLDDKTRFEHGQANESFVYRIDKGKAALYGYNITSRALITR